MTQRQPPVRPVSAEEHSSNERAVAIGRQLARQLFNKRGNHSEVHLSELELAAACVLAAERATPARLPPLDVSGRLREIDACLDRAQKGDGVQLPAARGKIQDVLDDLATERRRAHGVPPSRINVLLIELQDLERWLENGNFPESALTCRRAIAALMVPTVEDGCEPRLQQEVGPHP